MARGGLTALGTRGAREAGGPGPPRVIPRRDVVNQQQLHPVDTFAERHPANSPPRLLLSDIPSSIPSDIPSDIPADIPATNQNQQQLDFVRKKGRVLRMNCIFLILVDSIIEIITEKG